MNSITHTLEALKKGEIIIVVDDEKRENEGDFMFLADQVTPEKVNFLIKKGRGLVCIAMGDEDLRRLELVPMVYNNSSSHKTQFTISVDAKHNVSTGISASDRARTIRALISQETKPDDLARPGHIFPLRAADGGVLRRAGHTEAAVDLAKMAGAYPAGVICEVMREDGEMARMPELVAIAKEYTMPIISVGEIIAFRRRHEILVEKIGTTTLPTRFGLFDAIVYRDVMTEEEHVALIKGKISPDQPTLVRVHSSCLTGDVFGSLRCDCGNQLEQALKMINEQGGVILYMEQEGRGIGLGNKIRAYHLQDEGFDTVEANEQLGFPADLRDYGIGAQILHDLGIQQIRLLTNNPDKIVGLEDSGLEVVERISITTEVNPSNKKYLETKKKKLRHLL